MAEEAESGGERTEEATAQRREEFRRQGLVAQSKEIGSVLILFGCALIIWMAGRFFLQQITFLFSETFNTYFANAAQSADVTPALRFAGERAIMITAPFLVVCVLLGFASSVLQIGFVTKEDALTPNLGNIDPLEGFRKLFSLKSLIEGLKALLKISVLLTIGIMIVKKELYHAPTLIHYSLGQMLTYFGSVTFRILSGVGVLMVVLSVFDYAYQRWEIEKKMRMSKQEVKDEFKSREGDPQIRARIRRIQREMSQKRMMEAIPKASVVITNPTHLAIALKYDDKLPAPQVVAKGAGEIAKKIREKAKEFNIPIVENKPLARALYKTIKVGQLIPRELYNAVAEVLAYVYKLKRKVLRRNG